MAKIVKYQVLAKIWCNWNSCTAWGDADGTATLENRLAISYEVKHSYYMIQQSHPWVFTLEK